jgi:hypothetical protein
MNLYEHRLENESSSDNNDINDKLCIELTYYADNIPSIKSYYIMTNNEYEELKTLHMDLYIENFLNDEDLKKEQLDIYIVNNVNNINKIKNFIDQFGNPFDIINLINIKQAEQKQLNKIKEEILKTNNLIDKFSDSNSESTSEYSNYELEDIYPNVLNSKFNSLSVPLIKPKLNIKSLISIENNINSDDESDNNSESYIDTVTEIIDTFNKSKKIDDDKLKAISLNRPHLLKDNVLNELISN